MSKEKTLIKCIKWTNNLAIDIATGKKKTISLQQKPAERTRIFHNSAGYQFH